MRRLLVRVIDHETSASWRDVKSALWGCVLSTKGPSAGISGPSLARCMGHLTGRGDRSMHPSNHPYIHTNIHSTGATHSVSSRLPILLCYYAIAADDGVDDQGTGTLAVLCAYNISTDEMTRFAIWLASLADLHMVSGAPTSIVACCRWSKSGLINDMRLD